MTLSGRVGEVHLSLSTASAMIWARWMRINVCITPGEKRRAGLGGRWASA
jgi:hypothetical protein